MNEPYLFMALTAFFVLLYYAISAITKCSALALVFSLGPYLYALMKVYLEDR